MKRLYPPPLHVYVLFCSQPSPLLLGFAPLLRDVFFQGMAVVVMFGLGFATILTLMVLPVLYDCLHRPETP